MRPQQKPRQQSSERFHGFAIRKMTSL